MSRLKDQRDLAVAVWKTWGGRGLARRVAYELAKRDGRLQRAEDRWISDAVRLPASLTSIGIRPRRGSTPLEVAPSGGDAIRLYGALDIAGAVPPDWHRHPLTGHLFDPMAHWSTLSDASVEAGDIKDVWELSRFGWLYPRLREWTETGNEDAAERIWAVIEDWVTHNPPFRGPHWMCGQETSLRGISVMFLADALAASPTSTPERRALVAELVVQSVGRVEPTLGYALSQRNNHAISEAGFLWTATLLAAGLPNAAGLQAKAAKALTEAVTDQFAADGSYAQHSPTYQRVALHVLLWCLLVARTTGAEPPRGVADAVRRSVPFLRSLIAPLSEGRVPNVGGNDGALLFDLAPVGRADLRPVIAHAAAATGQASGFGPGPWDEEMAWFGLSPIDGIADDGRAAETTHALTRGTTHAVVRVGPLHHRPAHADQLHTDIWLAGAPVAVDPGSYRYTAPAPWGDALAGDDVHNVPHRAGAPQAVRAGRFFWRRWAEGRVLLSIDQADLAALAAELELPDGTRLRRLVAVREGLVVVVDQSTEAMAVRWNLPLGVSVEQGQTSTSVAGSGWAAQLSHGPGTELLVPSDDDPASGWHAPTYGIREPLTALMARSDEIGRVASCFADAATALDLPVVVTALASVDLAAIDKGAIERVLRAS